MSVRRDLAAEVDALTGGVALPRSNGELTFGQPWEARAFSLAVALCEAGRYEWNGFRDRLIEAVAAGAPDDGSHYYEAWMVALESLVVDRGLLDRHEILDRMAVIRAEDSHSEHGHEDSHDHHHAGH
jgi:nitrile hydratase accessory protein